MSGTPPSVDGELWKDIAAIFLGTKGLRYRDALSLQGTQSSMPAQSEEKQPNTNSDSTGRIGNFFRN
jgi:hypothetical protein